MWGPNIVFHCKGSQNVWALQYIHQYHKALGHDIIARNANMISIFGVDHPSTHSTGTTLAVRTDGFCWDISWEHDPAPRTTGPKPRWFSHGLWIGKSGKSAQFLNGGTRTWEFLGWVEHLSTPVLCVYISKTSNCSQHNIQHEHRPTPETKIHSYFNISWSLVLVVGFNLLQ